MDFSIDQYDLTLIGDTELDEKGLVYSHISSANDLYSTGIPQIFSEVFELKMRLDTIKRDSEEEKAIDHLDIKVSFSNINIEKPVIMNYEKQEEDVCYPNMARVKKKTYKSNLKLDIKVVVDAVMINGTKNTREDTIRAYKLCKVPIVVGSRWCNTYGLTKESLVRLHEDPYDAGGYFIINGVEWSVDCVENILFNKVRIFKNEGYKKEKMRAEFISKPGDHYLNSDQFIVRWLSDGQLTIEIHREKMKELEIPFYLLFRMMGWNSDKQIFDNLLFEYESQTSKKIIQFLSAAFEANYEEFSGSRYIYSQTDTLQYIAEKIAESKFNYLDVEKYPENYQKITNYILDHIDTHFLQHMGTDENSRHQKMRFMCVVLRKVFLVNLKNMQPTDRDSYNSKRIHASGISLAKSIKTAFNATIIQQIKKKLTKDFGSMSFFKLDLGSTIRTGIYGSELEKTIRQSITSGTKTETVVRQKARVNRITSQMLNRKNQLSALSTLRQITANSSNSAKQSDRANEMRRVHMSTLGYVCVIHSPEGEKVGINKQLALFAFITGASSSEVIKDILLDDKDIRALNTVDYRDIAVENLCNVYVNGIWIGCCKDALAIARKYRQKRRKFEINPETTIVWDNTQDEVYFWTDAGRVIRPLMIVYNNKRDPERYAEITGVVKKKDEKRGGINSSQASNKFEQGLAIKQFHIDKLYAKNLSVEEMLREQLIEYISAEEQENMLLAPDFNTLKENRHNELMEYTHCDFPQAKLGITALTCPYAGHNQAHRIIYQTSQSKQTCGVFAANWPYRADKDTFLQYNNETPLVKTIANRYLFPNGSNCMVAMMCNTGYNVEDSLIINKGAVDRGLFNGSKFHFYESKLEQNEEFANPDITNTLDIKSADFSKLTKGIIKKGVVLGKNDAIIGKILRITKNIDDRYQYADRSTIYKDDEPAIVHDVIIDRNEEEEEFVKVILRKLRPVDIGDKFSVRASSQVLTLEGWKEIQYITTTDKVATLTKDNHLDYVNPAAVTKYHYTGAMYHLDDSNDANTNIFVTKNHKLYTKPNNDGEFTLKPTDEVFGKGGIFKSWVDNNKKDYRYYVIGKNKYPVDDWLRFVGLYITKGYIEEQTSLIHIYGYDNRCAQIIEKINIVANKAKGAGRFTIYDIPILDRLRETFKHENLHLRFADYLFTLSANQSRILLDTIFELSGCLLDTHYILDFTDIQNLALNAEMTLIQKDIGSRYEYELIERLEPEIDTACERYVSYDDLVFCLEIPDTHQHVYYSRETNTSTPLWTGNSTRGDAQVLTSNGWKEIQNLDIEKDMVATMTTQGKLDYVYSNGLSVYDYDGDMYELLTQQVQMFVTRNHKVYVKRRDKDYYEFLRTYDAFGKRLKYKKWVDNNYPEQKEFTTRAFDGSEVSYPMDAWLKLLGIWIADGFTDDTYILICAEKKRKKDFHEELLNELGVEYKMTDRKTRILGSKYKSIWWELSKLNVGAINKSLPSYVWNLSQRQSKILLNSLIEGDGCRSGDKVVYCTSSKKLADDVVRLALHAGYSGTLHMDGDAGSQSIIPDSKGGYRTITKQNPSYRVSIIRRCNEPMVNHGLVKKQNFQKERYVHYSGKVYCLSIPDTHQHVWYMRMNDFSCPHWTSNSARSGQKGTIGLILDEADMPRTADGIAPAIIMNPHSIPSRMTTGQLIESLVSGICAEKATQIDGTIFKKMDIESCANELENLGFHRYGYKKLYNGITGEWIDCLIFMYIVYYQRLQKFTDDTKYAISSGPTDALTRQLLNGKSSGGGLRIGEMERDVLGSQGVMKFMTEKWNYHSDGFTNFVCRCGKMAVVNIEKGIYKCNYCRDKADIVAYNTSWSSKLFLQELESMNVGIRQKPKPFIYSRKDVSLDKILLL